MTFPYVAVKPLSPTIWANSVDDKLLFFFPQKTGFDISYKITPMETICMKYQNLFSRKIKKIFLILPRVLSVHLVLTTAFILFTSFPLLHINEDVRSHMIKGL